MCDCAERAAVRCFRGDLVACAGAATATRLSVPACLCSPRQPSATACVSYTFNNGNDNVYPCVNGLNRGYYAYNNLQMFDSTWYHKFSESWHMATEAWYMYERDVPSVSGPIEPEKGTNGAFCSMGQVRCLAPEWAMVNYVEKQVSARNCLEKVRGAQPAWRARSATVSGSASRSSAHSQVAARP